jgi:hypothetical protein
LQLVGRRKARKAREGADRWRRQQRLARALWKLEWQRLANELDISIEVHHLPPETRKWNKIEHRLFSFITQTGGPNRWLVIASSLI